MASSSRQVPYAAEPGQGRRLNIRAIGEVPSAYDEEIAVIFREMREASQLAREDIARRLRTSPRVIEALEAGALLALPPWPETSRVITAYTELLQLDGQPILRRIYSQLKAYGAAAARAREAGAGTAAPPRRPEGRAPPRADARPPPGRRGRLLPWVAWSAIVAALAGAVLYASLRPDLILAVTDAMPEPIAQAARSIVKDEAPAPTIDDSDPRSRKADRLPVAGERARPLR